MLVCLGATILGFFAHSALGLEPATIALSGAALYLLISGVEIDHPLAAIEWTTLFFFVGLFVVVGALEVTGVLDRVTDWLAEATEGSPTTQALGILWGSAIASGIVDNIPFTAAMAPVVDQLGRRVTPTGGPCRSGPVTAATSRSWPPAPTSWPPAPCAAPGRELSFMRFLRVGVPATIASMVVATLWIILVEV